MVFPFSYDSLVHVPHRHHPPPTTWHSGPELSSSSTVILPEVGWETWQSASTSITFEGRREWRTESWETTGERNHTGGRQKGRGQPGKEAGMEGRQWGDRNNDFFFKAKELGKLLYQQEEVQWLPRSPASSQRKKLKSHKTAISLSGINHLLGFITIFDI